MMNDEPFNSILIRSTETPQPDNVINGDYSNGKCQQGTNSITLKIYYDDMAY